MAYALRPNDSQSSDDDGTCECVLPACHTQRPELVAGAAVEAAGLLVREGAWLHYDSSHHHGKSDRLDRGPVPGPDQSRVHEPVCVRMAMQSDPLLPRSEPVPELAASVLLFAGAGATSVVRMLELQPPSLPVRLQRLPAENLTDDFTDRYILPS